MSIDEFSPRQFIRDSSVAASGRRAVVAFVLAGLVLCAPLAGLRCTPAAPAPQADTGEAGPSVQGPAAGKAERRGDGDGELAATANPAPRSLRIHATDSEGKPITNAEVRAFISTAALVETLSHRTNADATYRTNADGSAVVQVPWDEPAEVHVLVSARGYVTALASWRPGFFKELMPPEFTIALEAGTTLGGIVRDEQGRPIAGAEVTIGAGQEGSSRRRTVVLETAKTNADGKWQCQGIPGVLQGLSGGAKVHHPDYVSPAVIRIADSSIGDLRAKTAVILLRKGVAVEGTVTGPKGNPVAGADVGRFAPEAREAVTRAKTDLDGRYHLPSQPGEYSFAAAADGYAPCSRRITVGRERMTVDLQLVAGESIRFRVVDPEQKPLTGVSVGFFVPKDKPEFVWSHVPSATDAEGRWSGTWIPKERLTFVFTKPGYLHVGKAIVPGGQEETITMKPEKGWTVAGRVVDRATGMPVTKFLVVEGSIWNDEMNRSGEHVYWSNRRLVENEHGEYRVRCGSVSAEHPVVRIEADSYYPSETRRLTANDRQVTFNVALSRGQNVSGVVLSPDGKPLDDALVILAPAASGLHLTNNFPSQSLSLGFPPMRYAGLDGRFAFLPQREPYILVAIHEQGYGWVEGKTGLREIRVRPWARLAGTVRVGNRPVAEDTVNLNCSSLALPRPKRLTAAELKSAYAKGPDGTFRSFFAHTLSMDYSAKTDEKGQYVFERVPSGKAALSRFLKVTQDGATTTYTGTQTTPVELVPGKTLRVDLGGIGRPVIGRAVLAEKKENVKFYDETVTADRPPTPDNPTTTYTGRLKGDGSFRFEELPAGKYRLSVWLTLPDATYGRIGAMIEKEFIVPAIPGGHSDQPLDLGTLKIDADKWKSGHGDE